MKKVFIILFALLVYSQFSHAQSGLDEAEDFLVKDVYGTTHTLFSYLEENKIVVVPFFTTTCGTCNIYTPEIVESFQDFGCNQGDVFYLGVNWGANNIGVIDFMAVHAVEYPCASGLEGLGNQVNEQYEIASHITALVIQPDGTIAGQFYGPNAYPTRDSLNNLLLSLGAEMQSCGVGINENTGNNYSGYPNPASDHFSILFRQVLTGEYFLQIINAQGINFRNERLYFQSIDNIRINTSDLNDGTYFVRIIGENEILVNQKLIKK